MAHELERLGHVAVHGSLVFVADTGRRAALSLRLRPVPQGCESWRRSRGNVAMKFPAATSPQGKRSEGLRGQQRDCSTDRTDETADEYTWLLARE